MSLSVRDDATGLEYAGALGLGGLFPTGRNLARPAYLRMLAEIPRFHRRARALLADPRRSFRAGRHDAARLPARAAGSRRTSSGTSWSRSSPRSGRATRTSPWTTRPATCSSSSTTTGCSASSGRRMAHRHRRLARVRRPGARPLDEVRVGTKVTSVPRPRLRRRGHRRQRRGHHRTTPSWSPPTPAQALAMLAEPTPDQREVLGAIPVLAQHRAAAHRRPRCCRAAQRAPGPPGTSSARRPSTGTPAGVTVTYDLTRLQRLDTDTRYLVTLGGEHLVDPANGDRPDGVRAPALHAGLGRGPAPAARDQHGADRVRRAPTTAGGSTRTVRDRGWRPSSGWASSGRAGGSGRSDGGLSRLRRQRASHSTTDAAAGIYATTIRAHPAHAVPPHVHAPLPHLAGRPRRRCPTTGCSAGSRRATTSATPDAVDPRERRRVPRRERRRRRPAAGC